MKSLAEVTRNQKRGDSYYQNLAPIVSSVQKTGQDVGQLTKGLGKVYKTLLELNGKAPFEGLDDLDRALKWVQKKKKPKESFEGCLVRLDTHNQCLQKLNRTLLERLSKEKEATKVACKRLGMEAVRSTLLEERIKDVDRAYDEGFFQMLTETMACSMEEEGVTDLPAGMHFVYDAQGLLREGVEPNDQGVGRCEALRRKVSQRLLGRQGLFDVGDDERPGLERGPAGGGDLQGRRSAARGGPWRGGRRVLSRLLWLAHGNVRSGSLRAFHACGGRAHVHPLLVEGVVNVKKNLRYVLFCVKLKKKPEERSGSAYN